MSWIVFLLRDEAFQRILSTNSGSISDTLLNLLLLPGRVWSDVPQFPSISCFFCFAFFFNFFHLLCYSVAAAVAVVVAVASVYNGCWCYILKGVFLL